MKKTHGKHTIRERNLITYEEYKKYRVEAKNEVIKTKKNQG